MNNKMVNLLVDLRAERFSSDALLGYLAGIESVGFSVEEPVTAPGQMLAWVDYEFGGTWSSEVFAGRNILLKRGARYVGFVTYDPRGLRFDWLARWHEREDTGIFGPFGVSTEFRGSAIGRNLLGAALARLRQIGYDYALIPAVSGEQLIGYYIKNCGAEVVERFGVDRKMSRRFRTTVLASGNGTNLQAVLDGARGTLPVDVAAVITNNEAAFALERARTAGVQTCQAFPWNKTDEKRSAYDARLSSAVERTEPELVLLLGWMHVLPGSFIELFSEIINIHPAFLPLDQGAEEVAMPDGSVIRAYRGAHAIRDALADRSLWIGATAHKVTEQADRGPVLARKPQAIEPSTAVQLVQDTLRPLEHRVLRDGIMRWVFEQPHTLSPV